MIIISVQFTRDFQGKDVIVMKIEKVNDNQIRCTLTREDLDSRHMKLSELDSMHINKTGSCRSSD